MLGLSPRRGGECDKGGSTTHVGRIMHTSSGRSSSTTTDGLYMGNSDQTVGSNDLQEKWEYDCWDSVPRILVYIVALLVSTRRQFFCL